MGVSTKKVQYLCTDVGREYDDGMRIYLFGQGIVHQATTVANCNDLASLAISHMDDIWIGNFKHKGNPGTQSTYHETQG
jgi:hypothetical protein